MSAIPSTEDLASGIMALSRQWKCLLGENDEEFRPAGFLKRPVVGRGVLTDRDRAILMKTEYRKSQEGETLAAGNFIEPVVIINYAYVSYLVAQYLEQYIRSVAQLFLTWIWHVYDFHSTLRYLLFKGRLFEARLA